MGFKKDELERSNKYLFVKNFYASLKQSAYPLMHARAWMQKAV